MRYLVAGGSTVVSLLLLIVLLSFFAAPATGQGPPAETESFFQTVFVSGGMGSWSSILMLIAIVTATGAGMLDAKRTHPWPLWPALVRGLGDAGFLFALITTFAGMRTAMQVLAGLGAPLTPAGMASGLANVLAKLVLGAGVALAGLAGAALLRWWRHRLLPKVVVNVADKFA